MFFFNQIIAIQRLAINEIDKGGEKMRKICDFHTHSFFSDGELLPSELIRRAVDKDYAVIGITDHAGMSNMDSIIDNVYRDCQIAEKYWDIKVIPGIEITHVPAGYIAQCAAYARGRGVGLIVVHGETIVEPVEPGTNHAAICSGMVDILAHPGFLSQEDARLAAENGVFIEVTARSGHSLTNAVVVQQAMSAGAHLLINSDSHAPRDLMSKDFSRRVGLGAGIPLDHIDTVLFKNPELLLQRIAASSRTSFK